MNEVKLLCKSLKLGKKQKSGKLISLLDTYKLILKALLIYLFILFYLVIFLLCYFLFSCLT